MVNRLKTKQRIRTIISIILMFVIIGMGIYQSFMYYNPVYKTFAGIVKYSNQDVYKLSLTPEFDTEGLLGDITSELDLRFLVNYDKRQGVFSLNSTLGLQNEILVEILACFYNDTIFIDSPIAFDESDYVYNKMNNLISRQFFKELGEYIDLVDLKGFNKIGYADAISRGLEGYIDNEIFATTYTITTESMTSVLEEVINEIKEDPDFFPWIQRECLQILITAQSDEFYFPGLELTEYDKMINYITYDFEDDFSKWVNQLMTDRSTVERIIDRTLGMNTIELSFEYSFLGEIKKMTVDVIGNTEYTLYFDLVHGYEYVRDYDASEGMNFTEVEIRDGIDRIEKLFDYAEEVMKENDQLNEVVHSLLHERGIDDLDGLYKKMFLEIVEYVKEDLSE